MFFRKKRQGEFDRSKRKGSAGYTLLIIPNETGLTRRLSLPKGVFFGMLLLAFIVVGGVTGITLEYVNLRAQISDYDRLKAENSNIRSEAVALAERLEKVQSTLTQVDNFSDQVRAVVQSEPGPKKKSAVLQNSADSTQGNIEPAIGPLSKEEFAALKTQQEDPSARPAGVVKHDNLEFKNIFARLSDIQVQGEQQAKDLSMLLGDLQAYRKQLDATPTISPVKGWVTSMFGFRTSPFLRKEKMHWGLDIAAPMGSPIRSAGNGTIVKVGHVEDYGKFVEVSHGYGLVTRYAHAQAIHVKVGDKVKKGTTLGAVGMTGRTTGPHLHYEIELNGRRVDPSTYIRAW